jgi:predicted O-methyltransferase YrrM
MDNTLFEQVDHYIGNLLAQEDGALKHATAQIEQEQLPNMSISASQGKMLQVLAIACNAKRILELGTFGAYSTIWLGRALPADGKLITLEYDPRYAAMAQKNIAYAGLSDRIEIQIGKAMERLQEMHTQKEAPFDLVFMDADKPPYKEYFELVLKLSRPGTIIVCDNVIRKGKVLDPVSTDEAVRGVQRLNEFLPTCKGVTATILQTVGVKDHDGMVIAVVNSA